MKTCLKELKRKKGFREFFFFVDINESTTQRDPSVFASDEYGLGQQVKPS